MSSEPTELPCYFVPKCDADENARARRLCEAPRLWSADVGVECLTENSYMLAEIRCELREVSFNLDKFALSELKVRSHKNLGSKVISQSNLHDYFSSALIIITA